MAFRPNYRQARGERDRAKRQKKQEKLRKREEDAAARKAEHEPGDANTDVPAADPASADDVAASVENDGEEQDATDSV